MGTAIDRVSQTSRTRTRIATVAALIVAFTVGTAGAALAAKTSDSADFTVKYNTAITKGTFNLTSLTKQAGGPTQVHPIVRGAEAVAHVSGYASGGPWNDEQCQFAADAINALVGLAVDSFIAGDGGSATTYAQEAENTENQALDNGCGIKHSKGAAPEPEPEPQIG